MLMSVISIILLLRLPIFSYSSTSYHLEAIIGTLILTVIIPIASILFLRKKGKINDWFISNKEERRVPYIISIIAYTSWIVFLYQKLNFPIEFALIGTGSVLSILGLMIINYRWKISAHSAGVGGLLGGILSISYITLINPVWLIIIITIISGLVVISRIVLKAHTPSQVTGGFIWGFVCFTLPLFFLEIFNNWLQTQPVFD